MKFAGVFLILFSFLSHAFSQTCCSTGTPILSTIEASSLQQNQFKLSLSAEHNQIDDVLLGKQKIEASQTRSSQTVLLDLSYGLSNRWSFSALFSFITQQRQPLSGFGNNSTNLSTTGIGDALLIARYNIIKSNIVDQRQLSIGMGIKTPLGNSNQRDENGIRFPADFQSGTGSWDGVTLLSFSQGFKPTFDGSVFTSFSYRFNGRSNLFYQSDGPFDSYKFGNVFSLTIGTSYSLIEWVDLTIQFRLRKSAHDKFAGQEVFNSSGEWHYLIPGINVNYDPFGMRITAKIPTYRNLSGIQITTSYSVMVTFYYFLF